ncbi:DNA polymerase I family protein with 3'-5'-exonuclease and polymerase domains [Schinkia azotoformans MEV2011]|uniref:DNA-directed DNA polymerase n=1 Tax=Schinkia azotoformans MEV2011 TaxID=1348973 RepID=A0A072NQF2_SCHAZ|nr:DNA polymerase [Schinkia azotoformans]KEF39691.1 DNA polymerase I family protein with 3'-5'-exonuclease and polymerase domains [Schinkia azotoformans MEV2011]
MKTISVDIETFSSVDLGKCGVYRYCESPDFEVLLFGYSIDGGEVQIIDLVCGEKIPPVIISALSDPTITKWAFNAQFERICLSRFLGFPAGTYLDPTGWHCTMVWSATLGLPLSLEGVGSVLGLEKQKLQEGKSLIKYFCVPCAATKSNGGRRRNLPQHETEKWETFKAYNKRDVETEIGIQEKLSKFPVSDTEWDNYRLDQIINDRGITLDMDFVKQAICCDEVTKTRLRSLMQNLTNLENPNSVQQMKEWLADNGLETDTLGKAAVAELIKTAPADLGEVLSLRQELAKSSVKKYTAMENVVGSDGRARGLIQFYGANRTGRYAGRLIQVQNLPQNHLPDLEDARNLIKSGLFDAVDMLYDSTSGVLSELIRTAFVPKDGSRFIVADFSAIEARIIAWFAGERWRMDVFENGGDIYCASASQMFHVPVEKNGVNGHLRQKGKIAELALGYGGSVGALKAMGALQMGVLEDELQPLVTAWRQSNPRIVKLWWDVDKAAMTAVRQKTATETHGIRFTYQSGMLFITLPSGRNLVYIKPRIGVNQFGSDAITYEGIGGTKKWERIESYGPKFVENIVQATARDILAEAMLRLSTSGFEIVMHVHDEAVLEIPSGISSVDEICRIMAEKPKWANGLLLSADGFECKFYKKD